MAQDNESWYDKGYDQTILDLAEDAEISVEQAKAAYSFLSDRGFIDYDVEKEIFYEMFADEEDDYQV